MRRSLLLVSVFLVAGCDGVRTTPVSERLAVFPAELDFGEVVVGVEATRTVNVTNGSRAARHLEVRTELPFSADSDAELPAGAGVVLSVRVTPAGEGPFSGTLSIESDGQTLTVPLRAVGAKQPVCAASHACQTASFSATEGRCVETPAPDGTACSNPCLQASSTCVGGACVGTSVACDDADACTVDACGETGCVHAPVQCAPSGPCGASHCDPVQGCVFEAKPEGSDCGEGRVCAGGSCVWQRYTDEQLCGIATPCQPAGTWDGTQCVRPPKTTLQPVWTVTLTTGHQVDDLIVAPDDGTVFFVDENVEDFNQPSFLVALNHDGTERFRVPVGRPYGARGLTVSGASVLGIEYSGYSSAGDFTAIVSRDRLTGQEQWRRDVYPDLGLARSAGHIGLHLDGMGRAVTEVSEEFNTQPIFVVSIDLQTRAVLWTFELPHSSFIEEMDEQGRVLLHRDAPREAVVLDRDGNELWSMPWEGWGCDGFGWGYYVDDRARVFSSTDGGPVLTMPVQGAQVQGCSSPRTVVPGAAVMLGREYAPGEQWKYLSVPPTHLFTQQLPSGAATQVAPEDGKGMALRSWPRLTSRGGILSAVDDGASGYSLREVRTTGETIFDCPLPPVSAACCGLRWYGYGQVLASERWYVTGPYVYGNEPGFIRAFDVPGAIAHDLSSVVPRNGPRW